MWIESNFLLSASHKKICSWVLTEVKLVIFSAMSTLVFVFFMQVHAACPSASEQQYPSCTPAAWLSGCVCQGGGVQLASGGGGCSPAWQSPSLEPPSNASCHQTWWRSSWVIQLSPNQWKRAQVQVQAGYGARKQDVKDTEEWNSEFHGKIVELMAARKSNHVWA